jgi:hypothetical protein
MARPFDFRLSKYLTRLSFLALLQEHRAIVPGGQETSNYNRLEGLKVREGPREKEHWTDDVLPPGMCAGVSLQPNDGHNH